MSGRAPLEVDRPSVGQLRARIRHVRSLVARDLEVMPDEQGLEAAVRRAKVFESLATFELAIAELQAHPDWHG